MSPDSFLLAQMRDALARQRAGILGDFIAQRSGRRALSGPFKDMLIPERTSWGGGDKGSKLLGCYEQELHKGIERAILRHPDTVVNVGCAEGYYAVGLARRLPAARVVAFDLDAVARDICAGNAKENGVSQIELRGECTPSTLRELVDGKRAFVFMDCEGLEAMLLTPAIAPSLRSTDVIVECHDFVTAGVTASCHAALSQFHDVEVIAETGRDPNQYGMLHDLSSLDRWLAVCEFRPCAMQWLAGWSRDRA